MSNKTQKLLISLTTAAALGATAVINNNQSTANAANISLKTENEYQNSVGNKTAMNTKNKIIDQQYIVMRTKSAYNTAKLKLSNNNTTVNQSENSVNLSYNPKYNQIVQNYIKAYQAGDTSAANQISKQFIGTGNWLNWTYTGNTPNDKKTYYVGDNYDNLIGNISAQDMQEIQQTIANAINTLRDQLGISQTVGHVIPNENAYNFAIDTTYSTVDINNLQDKYKLSNNVIEGNLDTYISNPRLSADPTRKDDLDAHAKETLTLAQIKQLYLLRYLYITKKALGVEDWQLDNIKQNGTHDSYMGLYNDGPAMIATIPDTASSFTDNNAYQNMSQANLTQTTNPDHQDESTLQQAVAATKSDYDAAVAKNNQLFDTYNRATGNPSWNRQIGSKDARYKYFQKTGKLYIPGGYKLPGQNKTTKKTTSTKKIIKKAHKTTAKKSHKKTSKKARIIKRDRAKAKKYGYHIKKNKVVTRHGKVVKHWTVKKHHIYNNYKYRIK